MSLNAANNPEHKSFDYYIPPTDDGQRSTPSSLRRVRLAGWAALSFASWPLLLAVSPMIADKSLTTSLTLILIHFCLASGYALKQRTVGKLSYVLAGVALILFGTTFTVFTTEPSDAFIPALSMLSDLVWLPLGIASLIYATLSTYQAKQIQRQAPISAKAGILLVVIPALYYICVTYMHLPL